MKSPSFFQKVEAILWLFNSYDLRRLRDEMKLGNQILDLSTEKS